MKKKPAKISAGVSEPDRRLFRESVGEVRPLRHDRVTHEHPKPAPRPRFRELDEQQVLKDMLSDQYDPADIDTGDELLYAQPGLQQRVLKKLRRGQYPLGAECDLHGMTVAEARPYLAAFLHGARRHYQTCVRIIHGKGLGSRQKIPVLKHKVNQWLRQREEVLAFCTARRSDGGSGAVYVLLKARR